MGNSNDKMAQQIQVAQQEKDAQQQQIVQSCKDRLSQYKEQYTNGVVAGKAQLASLKSQLIELNSQLLQQQTDGGKALKRIQDLKTIIPHKQAEFESKRDTYADLLLQIYKLETQCQTLEDSVTEKEHLLIKCKQNESGSTKQHDLIATGAILATSFFGYRILFD